MRTSKFLRKNKIRNSRNKKSRTRKIKGGMMRFFGLGKSSKVVPNTIISTELDTMTNSLVGDIIKDRDIIGIYNCGHFNRLDVIELMVRMDRFLRTGNSDSNCVSFYCRRCQYKNTIDLTINSSKINMKNGTVFFTTYKSFKDKINSNPMSSDPSQTLVDLIKSSYDLPEISPPLSSISTLSDRVKSEVRRMIAITNSEKDFMNDQLGNDNYLKQFDYDFQRVADDITSRIKANQDLVRSVLNIIYSTYPAMTPEQRTILDDMQRKGLLDGELIPPRNMLDIIDDIERRFSTSTLNRSGAETTIQYSTGVTIPHGHRVAGLEAPYAQRNELVPM
jgi:hypothetical protein